MQFLGSSHDLLWVVKFIGEYSCDWYLKAELLILNIGEASGESTVAGYISSLGKDVADSSARFYKFFSLISLA